MFNLTKSCSHVSSLQTTKTILFFLSYQSSNKLSILKCSQFHNGVGEKILKNVLNLNKCFFFFLLLLFRILKIFKCFKALSFFFTFLSGIKMDFLCVEEFQEKIYLFAGVKLGIAALIHRKASMNMNVLPFSFALLPDTSFLGLMGVSNSLSVIFEWIMKEIVK